MLIVQDISERIQYEEQLISAQATAEKANRTKSEFLANMSHEIRTPMNAILGLNHFLQRKEHNTQKLDKLKKISSAGEHLLSIINDVLDLSKIEAGKLELESIDFQLDSLIDSIDSLFKEQFKEKGISFQINMMISSLSLKGDPGRLRQAIINYLSNALKFTQKGKVILKISTLKEDENAFILKFEVIDKGVGIEANKQQQLFQHFEQADNSTTRKFGGTGLGLSITKRLVELMHGEVGVESELNKGSIFWFTAKLQKGKENNLYSNLLSEQELETELQTFYSGAHILLVEDNEINLEVAQDLLVYLNMNVDSAINGKQAYDKVLNYSYDLILMDIQMPVMDGLEATKLIRTIDKYSYTPILAMTAGVLEKEKKSCLQTGMDGFVAKPINIENLYLSLLKWLPKHSATRQKESPNQLEDDTLISPLLEQLHKIKGLDLNKGLSNLRGDTQSFLRLLHQFDKLHQNDISKINQALSEDNPDEARKLSHAIKGAAGTLGLILIQDAAKALEFVLKEIHSTLSNKEVTDSLESLITKYKLFHRQLKLIDNIQLDNKISGDANSNKSQASTILNKLEQLLSQDDTAAQDIFLESEAILLQVYGDRIHNLGEQIALFNYPQALSIIKSIDY